MTEYEYNNDAMTNVLKQIDDFLREQRENREKELAKIIQNYDFVVGSIECRHRLMEISPDGANIIVSHYIEDPETIYAIKKFDVMDLILNQAESEEEE